MKSWHWTLISCLLEAGSGVAMIMGFRASARTKTGDAWDKALADVTKPAPSEFSSLTDD